MAQTKAKHHEVSLVRSLGLFDITMIGVGAMIGAGIFVLTGIAAGVAGPALILSFALNGIITVFTAMVYAELGSAIPEAGGGYLWVKEGLPGPNAFLSGWMSWFAHAVAGSLYAVGFGGFVYELLRVFILEGTNATHIFFDGVLTLPFGIALTEVDLVQKGCAVLVILLFLYINYRGSSETGMAGNIVTVLKVIIIIIFIISGLVVMFGNPVHFEKFYDFTPQGVIGIASAMGLTFIAFEGYEIIVQAGEEVKEPRKNIPRAVFLSLAIVVPIYMLVALVIIGAPTAPQGIPVYQWLGQLQEVGIARAATQFMPFGTYLILIGGVLSTMSALNATTFSSTRVSFAMGRDSSLPDGFAKVSEKTRTPHIALLWTGVLIIFMAVSLPIKDVAAAADIMFLLLFLQVNIAVITIRRKYGSELTYGYLMPFFPIVPIVGIITKMLLAFSLLDVSPIAWGFAVVWMAVGFVLYYIYAQPRQQKAGRTTVLQQAELTSPEEDVTYRVLVSVANPNSLSTLIPPAIHAAQKHDGKITLLHIVTVPSPTPLSQAYEYIDQTSDLRDKAVSMVKDQNVPVEYIIRVAHDVASAIIDTVREKHADLLLMGWRGHSRFSNTLLGSNIDKIINEVNCELMILHPNDKVSKRILVPVVNPQQILLNIQAAQLFALDEDAALDILHVFPPNTPTADKEAFIRNTQRRVDAIKVGQNKVNIISVDGTDRRDVIIETSKDYDLLVLGATRDSWLKQRFFGNTPQYIAQHADTAVVLLRPASNRVQFGMHRTINYLRGGYAEVQPESRQRLIEQGFLDNEKEPVPQQDLKSNVSEPILLVIGILTLLAAAMIYFGSGHLLTWIGTLAYFALLVIFTRMSFNAPKSKKELEREMSS